MKHASQWMGVGWFIALIGLGLIIAAETPEWSAPGLLDSIYAGIAVFNVGVMGRSLVVAIENKPEIMSTRYVFYTWLLPLGSTFAIGIEFVREGYLEPITALLITIGLGALYGHVVGEIEERDEYEVLDNADKWAESGSELDSTDLDEDQL